MTAGSTAGARSTSAEAPSGTAGTSGLALADRIRGRYAWGWLIGSIWLVYLADTFRDAAANTDPVLAVLGTSAVAGFAVLYVGTFGVVRQRRRAGRRVPAHFRVGVLTAYAALFVVAALSAGESALAMLVFATATVMLVLPIRAALAVVALLVVVAELSPRFVPGWEPTGMLSFQILVTALAMWGVVQLVQRNVELALAQQQITELAVSQERTRFARDLHDILGHSLTVLAVKSELAGRLVHIDADRAAAEIADVERLAREALADVRSAVAGYREASLAGELVAARAALDAAGIEADLPTAVDVVPQQRKALFGWAVREGVTNVVRHSGARHCRVRLDAEGVEVVDDGRGAATLPAGSGHGLAGLRERAAAQDARVVTSLVAGGGFRLWVGW